MEKFYCIFLALFLVIASSCTVLRKSPKTDLTDGFYFQKNAGKKQAVYISIDNDSVRLHPVILFNHQNTIDSLATYRAFGKESYQGVKRAASFFKHSFDVDFITIPLKFRPAQTSVPPQLNTNLNGAIYLGYRTDQFIIHYNPNPLKKANRTITHYGFSIGAFTGLGNTAMTPTTANNYIVIEYDGVVWSKGITGIIAINNFTVGLSAGFDNLLDKNRKYWIYQTKPWVGLAFGLNLN